MQFNSLGFGDRFTFVLRGSLVAIKIDHDMAETLDGQKFDMNPDTPIFKIMTFADLKFNQGFFCVFANKRIFAFKIDGVTAITPDDVEFTPPQNMEVSL